MWHRYNSVVLLAGAISLSIGIACVNDLASAFLGLCMSLLVFLLARPKFIEAARRLVIVNIFVGLLFCIVPFTSSPPYIWQWGFLKLSQPGLMLCLLAAVKANAIVIIFLAWVAPLSVSELGRALRKLRCPDKLSWLFLMMDRNLSFLEREWITLMEAAWLRGFVPVASLRCYKTYAAMLAIFLLRAYERSVIIYEVMLLAGFTGKIPFDSPSRLVGRDFLFLASVAIALLVLYLLPGLWPVLF